MSKRKPLKMDLGSSDVYMCTACFKWNICRYLCEIHVIYAFYVTKTYKGKTDKIFLNRYSNNWCTYYLRRISQKSKLDALVDKYFANFLTEMTSIIPKKKSTINIFWYDEFYNKRRNFFGHFKIFNFIFREHACYAKRNRHRKTSQLNIDLVYIIYQSRIDSTAYLYFIDLCD